MIWNEWGTGGFEVLTAMWWWFTYSVMLCRVDGFDALKNPVAYTCSSKQRRNIRTRKSSTKLQSNSNFVYTLLSCLALKMEEKRSYEKSGKTYIMTPQNTWVFRWWNDSMTNFRRWRKKCPYLGTETEISWGRNVAPIFKVFLSILGEFLRSFMRIFLLCA